MIYFKEQYATVWEVEDHDNYAVVKMSTSRKDKKTDEFVNTSWAFVRFVGDAHKKSGKLSKQDRIKANGGISCEPYKNKDGERAYPKQPQVVVWDFEFVEKTQQKQNKKDAPPVVEEDDKLPF